MSFSKGQTLYTSDGTTVVFDHIHHGNAYVYPMIKHIMQSATYSGDDFYEEEDYEQADHLMCIPQESLYDSPPISVLNAEIAELQKSLSDEKAKLAHVAREAVTQQRQINRTLEQEKRNLERWNDEHKVMKDLARMLNGEPLFPLCAPENPYHGGPEVPTIPDLRKAKFLSVVPKADGEWTVTKRHPSDHNYITQFFYTEEERSAQVLELFNTACDRFRAKPKYSTEGKTYTTSLDFGTLQRWVEYHESLSIPDDIVAGKTAADNAAKEAKRAHLEAELERIANE